MRKIGVLFFLLLVVSIPLIWAEEQEKTVPGKVVAPVIPVEEEPELIPWVHNFKSPVQVTAPVGYGGMSSKGSSLIQPTGFQFHTPGQITAPDHQNPYNPHAPQTFNFKQPTPVGGASSVYSNVELSDFTGGLNGVDLPNRIADNEATEIQNFIWSPSGKLERRPGFKFRKDQTAGFAGTEKIWGLYPYYTSDGDNILLAGVDGTLWADTNQSGTFVSVKTGLQSNSKYYDFETFKGKAIVVHEGDTPLLFGKDFQESVSFGLADSFTWTESYVSTNVCTLIYTVEEDWTENEWSGFLLCDNKQPYESDAHQVPLVILSNTSNTLTVLTYSGLLNYWHKGYIFGLFDYDTLQANVRCDGNTGSGCARAVNTVAPACDTSMEGKCTVLRFYTGDAVGQERIVFNVPDDYHFELQYPFDPEPANGDSFHVLRKVFYGVNLCQAYKDRLFLVDEDEDGNIVYFSDYNNYTAFGSNSHFTLKTVPGDNITALATFYDDQLGYKDRSRDCMVIFKQNSIYKLVWNSATDYYLVQVVDNIGCVAPQSIANVEGKYLLFLHTTGVYAFDGRTVTLVSQKIQPTIDEMNESNYLYRACGAYYKDHYYLSYPDSGQVSNQNTIVFNTKFGSWTTATKPHAILFAPQTALTDTSKLLFADNKPLSLIYEFGTVSTDTGEAIPLLYKSKAFDFNSMADKKRFSYFDLDYYLGSGSLISYFYTDFGDSLRYQDTVTVSGGYRYARLPLDADCLGRNFSFKITSSNDLQLGKIQIKFKKLKE